jgi:hypothetical protein
MTRPRSADPYEPELAPSEPTSEGAHEHGIGNKAAYLMTDGDTFNGKTVTGIGLDKTEAVFYEARATCSRRRATTRPYNALQQACTNLIGTLGISRPTATRSRRPRRGRDERAADERRARRARVRTGPRDLFLDNPRT